MTLYLSGYFLDVHSFSPPVITQRSAYLQVILTCRVPQVVVHGTRGTWEKIT